MTTPRSVNLRTAAVSTSDGAGVRLYRSIGTRQLDHVDPFLLLDEFRSDDPDDYLKGFPDHPHRGFETVTYMLAGSMAHADSAGNRGELRSGDIQWMTAGRGIIHSEMPRQENGLMWGFQLWVNLPARDKMIAPRYQDIAAARVPVVELPGASVRVLAGDFHGVRGPVEGIVTEPLYLDLRLRAGARVDLSLPSDHAAFVYVFEGDAIVGEGEQAFTLATRSLGVLTAGDRLTVAAGDHAASLLLLAARPLAEPIARYGPFVMNTRREIEQAFEDYRGGRLTAGT